MTTLLLKSVFLTTLLLKSVLLKSVMTLLLLILYFYGWFRTLVEVMKRWLNPPRVQVFVCVWRRGYMKPTSISILQMEMEQENETEKKEAAAYCRYYVLFKERIMVFCDKETLFSALPHLDATRGSFSHFLEAEIKTSQTANEPPPPLDITCLLNQYDDGHGTFYNNHQLTPADLYDFSKKQFVMTDPATQTLTVTPMDTLEPRTVLALENFLI